MRQLVRQRRRPGGDDSARRARRAELFALTRALRGSVSGEHGLGLLKRGYAEWSEPVAALQRQIKAGFDPKGLVNPGKHRPADDPVSG